MPGDQQRFAAKRVRQQTCCEGCTEQEHHQDAYAASPHCLNSGQAAAGLGFGKDAGRVFTTRLRKRLQVVLQEIRSVCQNESAAQTARGLKSSTGGGAQSERATAARTAVAALS